VANAEFRWGINPETRGKTYFGACNFVMAGWPGTDGNAGKSMSWGTQGGAGLYHATSGNASVTSANGKTVSFANRCTAADGKPVANEPKETFSNHEARIKGGAGWVNPTAKTAKISWTGTFTIAYYDGLTYFWVKDPVLEVAADGSATVKATLGGYGADREDASSWLKHPDTPAVIAQMKGVSVNAANGVTLNPLYKDVKITAPPGSPAQVMNSTHPGSWPQGFVNFQGRTGLHSYWYSSGAAIDNRKPPDPIFVSWDADKPIEGSPETNVPSRGAGTGGFTPESGGWGGGSGGSGAGNGAPAAPGDADDWDYTVNPASLGLAPKDLVPERGNIARRTPFAVQAAILTLLIGATLGVVGWRREWFSHTKGTE
jgi:hypothetical protein